MKIFLLFYIPVCHFAMGLTHCYKTAVFYIYNKKRQITEGGMWTYWRKSRWRRISMKYYRHAVWPTLGMWLPWIRTVSTYLDAWLMGIHYTWRRTRGRPRKRWLDNIREDCEEMNLTIHQASRLANDRVKWRNTVHNKGSRSAGRGHRLRRRDFKSSQKVVFL